MCVDGLEEQIEIFNKMRMHCENCGADYLATGLEAKCPCLLLKDIEQLKDDIIFAAKRINELEEYIEELESESVEEMLHEYIKHDNGVLLTKEQVRQLWIALWYGKAVGERILIGKEVFGNLGPDDVHEEGMCPLCNRKDEGDA
jgi:hypothetical protein